MYLMLMMLGTSIERSFLVWLVAHSAECTSQHRGTRLRRLPEDPDYTDTYTIVDLDRRGQAGTEQI